MQRRFIKLVVLILLFCFFVEIDTHAQIYLKSEYIVPSKFKDKDGNNLGGKGGLNTIDGRFRIPVTLRIDENNEPTVWAISLGGTYASLDCKNISKEYYMREILNTQIGLLHMRPLNEKWSMMAALGIGIFTSDLNTISGNTILGQGGVLFIRHAKSNLDWGIGVAINNALGYPMIFPSLYLDWRLNGKYEFKLSMYDSFQVGVRTQINNKFKVGIIGESKGLMSAVKKDERSMYFVTQYGYLGVQPEFILSKSLSIPITAGVSFARDTYFRSKTLKAFFDSEMNYPHFNISAYISLGLKYGF